MLPESIHTSTIIQTEYVYTHVHTHTNRHTYVTRSNEEKRPWDERTGGLYGRASVQEMEGGNDKL